MSHHQKSHLAFALDYPSLAEAKRGAAAVAPYVGVLKVGLELFIKAGPPSIGMALETGCQVFLDLKLHDIPKTVERAVATACSLGAGFLTIHTAGGAAMMEAAAKRAIKENTGLKVVGVTVLTSLSDDELLQVGVNSCASKQVLLLANLAKECGLQGLVCSSLEVARVRETVGPGLTLITPGIRPSGSEAGDQKRTGTPREALERGADLLVVGRPIRDAANPSLAAQQILTSLQGIPA